jgi:uncharacterized membrane protein YbaN (DUF454 family)
MRKHIRRITVLALGWTLIGLGVIGLFLPILQGVLFILIGLYVLSRESETARHWLHKTRERYPSVDEKLKGWGERWRGRFHKGDRRDSSQDGG